MKVHTTQLGLAMREEGSVLPGASSYNPNGHLNQTLATNYVNFKLTEREKGVKKCCVG